MLIAVAGSQGSGKTTCLDEVHKHLPNSKKIIRKTSRSILDDWNVSLDEVNHDPDLSKRFQEEITARKRRDETGLTSSYIWLTERTHADLFTYTVINIGKHNRHSQWVQQYFEKCKRYQSQYDHVFYLMGGGFPIKDDGVRSINPSFGKLSDISMKHFTEEMTPSHKLTIVTEVNLDKRVNLIVNKINSLQE
jgi:Cdc6-like AAA superfamily ATPase